jgi:hypothetical protein
MNRSIALGALAALMLAGASPAAHAQAANAKYPKLYRVEWVYRIEYGFKEEWWKLFQKYQIPILDREQQLGYVLRYEIHKPDLHAGEDSRWDYRVIITYPDRDGPYHEGDVTRELFPDTTQMDQDEHRRWEITINHWDLPMHDVDPHGSGF